MIPELRVVVVVVAVVVVGGGAIVAEPTVPDLKLIKSISF